MKKFFSLSLAAALALSFAACSNEDVQPSGTDSGTGMYVKMNFRMATSDATRADQDYDANHSESSGDFVVGTSNEYRINKVYLYFFTNGDGKIVKVGDTQANYYEQTVNEVKNGTSNEANADGSAVTADGKLYSTDNFELPKGLTAGMKYRVYALINRPYTGSISTESDLLNSQLDFAAADISDYNGNLPMAARSQKGQVCEILKATTANTSANPFELDFEVERAYARIAFADTNFEVDLYSSTESNATVIGKVTLQAYQLVNTATKLYTYRHVGDITSSGSTDLITDLQSVGKTDCDGNAIQCPRFVGKIESPSNNYVIDPISGDKKSGALYSGNLLENRLSAATTSAGWQNLLPATASGSDVTPNSVEYVAENTMYVSAQKKGQTTGIIFKAKIAPTTIKDVTGGSHGSDPDLYFYNGEFYSSLAAIAEVVGKTEIKPAEMKDYGIRYFAKGIGYYEYYIRHENNGNYSEMGIMEFAIVRNNSYELKISKIAMSPYNGLPGDPDPDPNDPDNPNPDPDKPNPDDPDEGAKVYMQVDVVVRPWVVRDNGMILGN